MLLYDSICANLGVEPIGYKEIGALWTNAGIAATGCTLQEIENFWFL